MKKLRKTVPLPDDLCLHRYFSDSAAFFDIETTGFSPKNSFVYLIGMAERSNNAIEITQFLADKRTEEAAVLSAFFENLKSVRTLITFNGTGFDLPFLKARAALYGISHSLDDFSPLDLYKLTGKFAHLFHLPDKKQKSVEKFLGVEREDKYGGGELIPVYYAYEKQRNPQSEELLLLHNYEDVLGMAKLLPLLSYADFFDTPPHVLSVSRERCVSYDGKDETQELLLTLSVPFPFPKRIFCRNGLCSLLCEGSLARLLIKVFSGELRFYYENYKDYYYLPEEDLAVHKSIASFVDASHRKKATASTCYTRKSGCFLPQHTPAVTPCFYPGKKSGVSYFELTEAFLSDASSLDSYAAGLLKVLCKS